MAIPVFLFANQRSGTNFLRNILVSTGEFVDLNEVFQAGEPSLYWDHFRDEVAKNNDLAIPTKDNRKQLFESFLDKHVHNVSEKYVLIDIKYNCAHNLNTEFQQLHAPSNLLGLIKESGGYVIHLIRSNSLEVHISNVLANKTKVYTATASEDIKQIKIDLDPEGTLREIHKHQFDVNNFKSWLSDLNFDNYLELVYEDLKKINTDSDCFAAQKLRNYFEIDSDCEFAVSTQKIARNPDEMIVNYDSEIKPYLLASDFAKFIV